MTEAKLIEQIRNPKSIQRDVAASYALLLHGPMRFRANWQAVNGAILDRWGDYALKAIKKHAAGSACLKKQKSRAKGAGR